jgi:hypothetical protein
MLEYYPTLLEAAVDFRVFSRKILAEFRSKYNKMCKIVKMMDS